MRSTFQRDSQNLSTRCRVLAGIEEDLVAELLYSTLRARGCTQGYPVSVMIESLMLVIRTKAE